jgi:asparagine synthase (glutamine-hydrolysing)
VHDLINEPVFRGSQNYKVVLTGEGADEVLGGYDIFKEGKIRQFWAKHPESILRPKLLKRLYPYLDLSKSQTLIYLSDFFGDKLEQRHLPWFSHIPRWNTTARCKTFFSDELNARLRGDPIEVLSRSLPEHSGLWHSFNQAQYIEAKSLMGGYLLSSQGDRMLMASSVEGRFPYLDHRVIEFANRLPPALKMKVLNEKYLLKRSMRQYLPSSILRRHKQPYRAPNIPAFFGTRSPDYVQELLSRESLNESGYFNADKVGRLIAKINRGRIVSNTDNMALVGILSTQMWHHLFVKQHYLP